MTSPSALRFDTFYHIYNRGINGENIFIQERNYFHFFNLYIKYIEPIADTYAYCLLRNHFHVLVKIKPKSVAQYHPSKRFSDFFNAYAKAINAAYGRTGSLFQHPFGRVAITNDRHLIQGIAYIHQNPQKHGFVDDFREWTYSSYRVIITEQPTHIQKTQVLEWFNSPQLYRDYHNQKVTDQQSPEFAQGDVD